MREIAKWLQRSCFRKDIWVQNKLFQKKFKQKLKSLMKVPVPALYHSDNLIDTIPETSPLKIIKSKQETRRRDRNPSFH